VVFVDLVPAFDPLVRPDEGDLGSAWRALTELGQEKCETRTEALLVRPADPADDLLGELVPKEALAVERVPDRGANRLDVVARLSRAAGVPKGRPGGPSG
jgi:hypothetical protein